MRWTLLFSLLCLTVACGRTALIPGPPGAEHDIHDYVDPTLVNPAVEVDGGVEVPGCTLTGVESHQLPAMPRRPIDVLFVIDDSGSMGDDQQRLANNFESFFSAFREQQVDFHLGVVTTDMDATNRQGRLVSSFLTNATPAIDSAFSLMVNVGSDGSSIEQGLGATWAALHDPVLHGANAGFVRDDADLAIVYFGDEDDQSEVDLAQLKTDVLALKGGNTTTVVGILGLDDSWLCWRDVLAQWRLAQFTRSFGDRGALAICRADYADLLRSVAGRIVNGQCVVGLEHPLDSHHQVRVTLNGVETAFVTNKPDETYPQGSLEVTPCPEAGGTVVLSWNDCP